MSESTARFVVTGAPNPGPLGSLPPKRLNIVDFVKNEKMFSLYVQALHEMYETENDDITSYYRVGGIHGLPYEAWNGDPNEKAKGSWKGYCTHRSTLFPTWHRPCVVTVEQILQSHAARIAEEYVTEVEEWRKAAAELRQPFWDWAAPGQAVPPDEVIRLTKVSIRAKPYGEPTEVENPLFTYKFKLFPVPGSRGRFARWHTTLRHPIKDNRDHWHSNPDAVARSLSHEQECLTDDTFFMLVLLKNWSEFSNTRAKKGHPGTSLEGVHNTVHNKTGGCGHMGDLSMAGFDPIFYMHHANVDRLLSLWAAINPGVWVTQDKEVHGTFDMPDNTTVDGHTSLFPFPDSQITYWSSNKCTDTLRMGYMYPEFEGLDLNDPVEVKRAIGRIVLELYGHVFLTGYQPLERQPAASAATTTLTTPTIWTWAVRVHVKQFELEGSFQVLIFLGSVPQDPNEWSGASSYVGSFSALANGAAELCENCQAQREVVTEGYIHLENAIVKGAGGHGFPLDPDSVKPYLTHSLDWRVQMADGAEVPLEHLPSLEVTVIAMQIGMPFGDVLPIPVGEPVLHHDITSGRVGGAHPA